MPKKAVLPKRAPREQGSDDRRQELHLTRLQVIIGALGLVVAATGTFAGMYFASRKDDPPVEPGILVVVRPDIDVGGAEVAAIPKPSQPVDYLRAGTQLRVDCYRLSPKYAFAHISSDFDKDRWIDPNDLAMPQGGSAVKPIGRLGRCK